MLRVQVLIFLFSSLVVAFAVPTDSKNKKDRAFHRTLSDEDHDKDGHHNADYDHDAFLGHEEKAAFDQLSPEESKQRLNIIISKIDTDGDDYVTEAELKEWIKYVQRRYTINDTSRMWKDHTPEEDGILTWLAYQKRSFGYEDDPNVKGSRTEQYADMIKRDRRRWDRADGNKDGRLSKEEFMDFLHPEDAEHMREIVVLETIEDIDKNGDEHIDVEEYIGDMWPNREGADEEPAWVKTERKQFADYRDKNKDGKLDKAEVQEWLLPEDFDHATAEAHHLAYEADQDKDGRMSRQEILNKFELFVGSQATDYGQALSQHDEF